MYKDVEEDNEVDAGNHRIDSIGSGWKTTSEGHICDFLVSDDLSREGGEDIFIERDIMLTKRESL